MIRPIERAHVNRALGAWCTVAAGAALVLALSGSAQAAIPASERQVLLDLYTQTNGPGWTNSTGWNGPAGSECGWFGIYCDAGETHVQSINLYVNNLAGTLPPLTGLTALQYFYANHNHLAGSIPSLEGWASLMWFDVSDNQLIGSIPPLMGLTELQTFYVGSNQLTGSIPALSGLTSLWRFDVHSNQLTGAIPPLTGLTSLVEFHVGNNQLNGSIPSLTGLISLSGFDVGNNQLTGSIPPLTGLTSLQDFGVSNNQLTGSIPALNGLTRLWSFHAKGNQLTGSIPPLTGLTWLNAFNVSNNQLTGSIPALTDLASWLYWFDVSNNQLTGPAPTLHSPSPLYMGESALCPNMLDPATYPPSANDLAWNAATGISPWSTFCSPTGMTNDVMVVPVVAQTASYSTEVHVRNNNVQPITLLVIFRESYSSSVPSQRPCDPFTVPPKATRQLALGTQCTLGTGSHFGMLVLVPENAGGPQPFTVFSRSQTPQGVGFSVEGVPMEAFSAAPAYVEGLRRTTSGAHYLSNCFVGALERAVSYRLDALAADDQPLGGPITGWLDRFFDNVRSFDVLARAGAPAGDYDNVRVRFSVGLESVPFVAFCTMQESVTFGADFRIAKPADRAVPAVLVPIVAQTGSYSTEVHVRNHHAQDLTLAVNFHEADNSSVPGQRPCTPFTVPANTTAPLALGSQCTLGAGSHFGMLVLENTASPLGFTVFSRSQTPQGVGFSVEGFPLAGFGASTVAVEGLKRTATGPKYLANCFVGALGAALDYRLDLLTSDDVPLGAPLTGALQANRLHRYLDVLAAAGAPAGDYAGVRAKFSRTAGSGALLGFCTMQESLTFSADFRIGK